MRRVKNLINYVSVKGHENLQYILETTEDCVVVKSRRYRRYTLRGVPGRSIDVLLEASIDDLNHIPHEIEVQISNKEGRYDGTVRKRMLLRTVNRGSCAQLPRRETKIDWDPETITIEAGIGASWARTLHFNRLRSDLHDYNIARVYMWHAQRYYPHLAADIGYDEIRGYADAWASTIDTTKTVTLAEINRSASRALYRLSRDHGWRKLTLRERERYGLDAQWVRQSVIAERIASPLGVGEHTLQISRRGPREI